MTLSEEVFVAKHRVRGCVAIDVLEQRELELHALGDRFDHEVRVANRVGDLARRRDRRESARRKIGRDAPLPCEPLEARGDLRARRGQNVGVDVAERDAHPVGRRDLGDPVPHRPGAQDRDLFHVRHAAGGTTNEPL